MTRTILASKVLTHLCLGPITATSGSFEPPSSATEDSLRSTQRNFHETDGLSQNPNDWLRRQHRATLQRADRHVGYISAFKIGLPKATKLNASTETESMDKGTINYRLGTSYAVATAILVSFQEPFSALAARSLRSLDFMALTQLALVFSIPLLILRADSRRDFTAIIFNLKNWPKLGVIFLVGTAGLILYDVGLSSTHPIITAAVLNLSPFWAAFIAFVVSKRSISSPRFAFLACFGVAFCGAMIIAWSQIDVDNKILARDVIESLIHSKWIYALPMPALFALSGTLVYRWFSDFDEPAAIAANFVLPSLVLIPLAAVTSDFGQASHLTKQSAVAILLLLVGTLASAAAGRVFYQMALTTTKDDNGYVTMFFLLIPAFSALISWMLSPWIPSLQFVPRPMFFIGMGLVTIPLLFLSLISWRGRPRRAAQFKSSVQERDIEPASMGSQDRLSSGSRLLDQRHIA